MELIWNGIVEAIELLLSGDPEVMQITLLSLKISGIATGLSLLVGLPLGTALALGRFYTREFWLTLINTGMALPPVVVGLGVSIMNPVGGGHLSFDIPKILQFLPGAKSAAEISLRYVLATEGVSLTLSGMSTIEQVRENVKIADRFRYMTKNQRQSMLNRLNLYKKQTNLLCTHCGYCMPCPHGVNIPENMLLLKRALIFELTEGARKGFQFLRRSPEGDISALACRQCRQCLVKCPNKIPIIEQLAQAEEIFGQNNPSG